MNEILWQKDEIQIIRKGRIKTSIFIITCLFLSLILFSFKFDLSFFWLIHISDQIYLNIPFFSILLIALFLTYMHIEPFLLKIRRFDFFMSNLSVSNLKIVHITDTHVHYPYPEVTSSRLNKIMDIINKENPDFVIFTGDLISDGGSNADKDIATISNAIRRLHSPCYVVFGNHDGVARDTQRHGELVTALQSAGAICLDQETILFKDIVYISGLKPSLILPITEQLVNDLAKNCKNDLQKPHILLAHMPDAADAAAATGIWSFQFSGHSHGGQCVLPFKGGALQLPPGCKKYGGTATWNYKVGSMILHISKGVGVTPLPFPLIRFLCPPEISVINFFPEIQSV